MTNTTSTSSKKWNDEATAQLTELTAGLSPVPGSVVEKAAETLGFTVRSVAAKLRNLGLVVETMAKAKVPAFTLEQGSDLTNFLNANAGNLTYKEIAEQFADGSFTAKQIQGKILALELTGKVKPTEKVEFQRTYTADEEKTFVRLANGGAFIEDIAEALGKSIASIRGKALSLNRSEDIAKIPEQRESHANAVVDPVEALGDGITKMKLAEIVAATGKTERGIKTLLTRRGIAVADYNGKAKRDKADAKLTAVAA